MQSLTLLVLAAGMGSRYGGLKQLDSMGPAGETLLDYSVFDAKKAGFDRIVFVIRRDIEQEFHEKIGARYEKFMKVGYVFQELDALPDGFEVPADRVKPWGTGHAIWCARDAVKEPFCAINADDFYGKHAYKVIADHLRLAKDGDFAMAGYQLRRTLSDHGSVARGVCVVSGDGTLETVNERTGIERRGEGGFQKDASGNELTFTGEETVSMNFWGFTTKVFSLLNDQLSGFLKKEGQELKSEFYIPMAVAEMIDRKEATVRVLPTDAEWFGITYRDDKPRVVAELKRLTDEGAYPTPLWQ